MIEVNRDGLEGLGVCCLQRMIPVCFSLDKDSSIREPNVFNVNKTEATDEQQRILSPWTNWHTTVVMRT